MIEDMNVNRLICLLVAAVVAVSCEIAPSHITPLDGEDLKDYSGHLFGYKVILPVEMAEFAIDFDRYLTMKEDDVPGFDRFNGRITRIPGRSDMYFVNDGRVSCTVDTGGKSLWDEDASWRYYGFSANSYVHAFRTPKMYASVTDEVELVFSSLPDEAGKQLKVDVMGEGINAGVIMSSYEDGMYEWQMACFGEECGTTGLRAEYSTGIGTGALELSQGRLENGTYKEYVCDGMFLVNIFDGAKEVDWVKTEFRGDKAPVWRTSR